MDDFAHLDVPPQGQVHRWRGGFGCANTVAFCDLVDRHDRLFVYVANDAEGADTIHDELGFFAPEIPRFKFPDCETLPYDAFSPQQDVVAQRLETLFRLPRLKKGVIVTAVSALMQRLPPQEYVQTRSLLLATGDQFNPTEEQHRLTLLGYRRVESVFEHGEFAVRGGVFDIFPIGSNKPVRVDLFDEAVDSLRLFDPDTQRSTDRIQSVHLLPANEFPTDAQSIARFRQSWHEMFDVDVRRCSVYTNVSDGNIPEGVECYMPLFFERVGSLFDYVPEDVVFLLDEQTMERARSFHSEVAERFEMLRHDVERPLLKPNHLYLAPEELAHMCRQFTRIELDPAGRQKRHSRKIESQEIPNIEANVRASEPGRRLRDFVANVDRRVLVTAETEGRREHLRNFLNRTHMTSHEVADFREFLESSLDLAIGVAPIVRGCWLSDHVVISETQIFGERSERQRRQDRSKNSDPELAIRNLTELDVGVPIVHINHGVGRYQGLETLDSDGYETEYLLIEYAQGDQLFVPVSDLHLVSRYTGANDETAPLDKLGSDRWEKAKQRAAEKVRDVAAELLDIYARRETARTEALPVVGDEYEEFCDRCEFDLTPDQQQAVSDILDDLTKGNPTDRLVCGDVGFGKTEVAMRASYHVASCGRQVVVLVPTTLLAQQHYETFSNRFANTAHVIEYVSRMRSKHDVDEIIDRLHSGRVDVLIGTHRLLYSELDFRSLGLLIIDEEHRFGVRHKENLKSLRSAVDVLTLTATPIPRTLNMAIGGIQNLSIISTPPAKRLPIKTFVVQSNRHIVQEAINRELSRGGQVFYLHNRVETIEATAEDLQALCPHARIGIGHGQMRKSALESVMSDFYHRRCNVLVCSTIIESGIDVPNANTIVISRADRFGLAQLHQLRGRVGRSHRQAYAYLLTPPDEAVTANAQKRLDAIASAGELGIGFTLAIHDLEIRGAGELLGEEQSGHIETIGYALYMGMLQRTVEAMRDGRMPDVITPIPTSAEINLHLSALVPDDYVPDIHTRLIMYKRIASAETHEQLDDLQIEFIDRFGTLPDQLRNLFRLAELKLRTAALGIRKIDLGSSGGRFDFLPSTSVNPNDIVNLVQENPGVYSFGGESRLLVQTEMSQSGDRFSFVNNLLDSFLESDSAQRAEA